MGSFSHETCNISETGQDRTKLLLMTTGDRIRAFDWCHNQRPCMTLKGYYALSFKTRESFGDHNENLNEDRLYYQRRRCSPMTMTNSDNIRSICGHSRGFPGKGASHNSGVIENVFFGLSDATYSAPKEMRPTLLYSVR